MDKKVWLIGGTSESATISQTLADCNLPHVITVTTISAQCLYSRGEVVVGCLNMAKMQSFCQENNIVTIIDASHPYAAVISQQAIATATKLDIPYLRYERLSYQPQTSSQTGSTIIQLDSFDLLVTGDYLTKQRVLLTVGCQALPRFKSWHSKSTLFARILPKAESLATAVSAGFESDHLIAIRPPISHAMERALWQQWSISLVVTKASGKAGGEDIKRQLAQELGIPLIVVARPKITYPQQTSILSDVITFCQDAIFKSNI